MLVPLVFGERWTPAVVPTQLLALGGCARSSVRHRADRPGGRRPGAMLRFGAVALPVLVVALYVGATGRPDRACIGYVVFQTLNLLGTQVLLSVGSWASRSGARRRRRPRARRGVVLVGVAGGSRLALEALAAPAALALMLSMAVGGIAYLATLRLLFQDTWATSSRSWTASRVSRGCSGARARAGARAVALIAAHPARHVFRRTGPASGQRRHDRCTIASASASSRLRRRARLRPAALLRGPGQHRPAGARSSVRARGAVPARRRRSSSSTTARRTARPFRRRLGATVIVHERRRGRAGPARPVSRGHPALDRAAGLRRRAAARPLSRLWAGGERTSSVVLGRADRQGRTTPAARHARGTEVIRSPAELLFRTNRSRRGAAAPDVVSRGRSAPCRRRRAWTFPARPRARDGARVPGERLPLRRARREISLDSATNHASC
jgi:hypothetical protein